MSVNIKNGFAAGRLVFLVPGGLALLTGIAGGLMRLGWDFPLPVAAGGAVAVHGPLMVSGFLGTLIALERAVALNRHWGYFAPLGCGAGALLLVLGLTGAGAFVITFGSLVFVFASVWVVSKQPAPFTVVMLLGSLAWVISNIMWLAGKGPHELVLLWMAFFLLTITGERLELGRMLRYSKLNLFALYTTIAGFLIGGLCHTLTQLELPLSWSVRVSGIAMLGTALWLLKNDIARRTIRQSGLVRFIAVCLLSGYVWLAVGGALLVLRGLPVAGPLYDAVLHAFFLGFVFSMIFGHASIIFPSVLRLRVHFTHLLYVPLVLLQVSLLWRVAGDLSLDAQMRAWGAAGNAAAIALFFVLFVGRAAIGAYVERLKV